MFVGTHLAAFEGSAIPSKTIEAYLTTEYRIDGPSRFVILIGRRHYGLAALLADPDKRPAAAVLTAWNPFSQRTRKSENRHAQESLVRELDRQQLPHCPGYGADPSGKWPVEDSRLVVNVSLAAATALARKFRQNGFVWAGGDALPMLVLLR
jgi:uncharacterized protein DUF3293